MRRAELVIPGRWQPAAQRARDADRGWPASLAGTAAGAAASAPVVHASAARAATTRDRFPADHFPVCVDVDIS